jgi:hypothetical protein
VKLAADQIWIDEYHRNEITLGVRMATDHSEKYFPDRQAVDALQYPTIQELSNGFRDLNVDPIEGKDSAVDPPSSISSEPSEQEETPALSGPLAA